MIGYLRGDVTIIENDYTIIECQNVGYKVYMSANDISKAASASHDLQVFTSMYIREDIIALYGFLDKEDLALFELLITVSGVGPKAAINMFSVMSGNDIKFAIISDDVQTICKAPGIGKKTAQKLILELKDKFSLEHVFEERMELDTNNNPLISDDYAIALEALVSLGYSASEAKSALHKCKIEAEGPEQLIKEALKHLF